MSSILVPTHLRDKALEGIGKLPPFSPVLTKLLASLAKDDIMVTELADWIEKDTVLPGNVMRMVNSAAYGRMGTVSSVRHAITILGTNRLRNIVLGLSVCNMMAQLKLPAGWSTKQFNLHAVAVDHHRQRIALRRPVGEHVHLREPPHARLHIAHDAAPSTRASISTPCAICAGDAVTNDSRSVLARAACA